MNINLPAYVFDSFALLAYFEGESCMERVKEVLHEGEVGKCIISVSIINIGEVAYITEREYGLQSTQKILGMLKQLPIQTVPATEMAVYDAAHIKAHFPVAYADAFAISTAVDLDATVLTGDPEFTSVEKLINIEWLET